MVERAPWDDQVTGTATVVAVPLSAVLPSLHIIVRPRGYLDVGKAFDRCILHCTITTVSCWLPSVRTPVSSVDTWNAKILITTGVAPYSARVDHAIDRRMLLIPGQTWDSCKLDQFSIFPLDLRKQILLLWRFVLKSDTGNLQTEEAATAAQLLGEALAVEGDHGRSAAFYALAVDTLESLFGVGSLKVVKSLTGLGFALLHQVMLAGLTGLYCIVSLWMW